MNACVYSKLQGVCHNVAELQFHVTYFCDMNVSVPASGVCCVTDTADIIIPVLNWTELGVGRREEGGET